MEGAASDYRTCQRVLSVSRGFREKRCGILTIDPHQFEGLERFIAFLEDLKGRREPPRAYRHLRVGPEGGAREGRGADPALPGGGARRAQRYRRAPFPGD